MSDLNTDDKCGSKYEFLVSGVIENKYARKEDFCSNAEK